MRKKLHGVVSLLAVSLLVGGLALPTVVLAQDDESGAYEEGAGWGETPGGEPYSYQYGYDYDTDEGWFESWYGESDGWLR